MSDSMARATGAGGSEGIMIAGKECLPRPLGLRELAEIERDCLQRYRRSYLETYTTNLDLLPEDDRTSILADKMDEAARWDVDDLPPKYVCDPARLKITAVLKKRVEKHWNEKKLDDVKLRRLLATMLDSEAISKKEYTEAAGIEPVMVKVPYVNWWITGAFEGMITVAWICFKPNGVSREQVAEVLGSNPALLASIVREIENQTAPAAGNG